MLKVEKTSWLNRKLNDDKSSKWILVSPLILVLIVFMLYPTFYSLYMSFTDYIMRGSPDFVGLDNYRFALIVYFENLQSRYNDTTSFL